MYREGHYGAALLAYAPLGFVALIGGFETVALVGALVAAGLAMVPDYDQRVPGIAHRGPTHTVWFAALVGLGVALAGGTVGWTRGPVAAVGLGGFGFLVGTATICSHVAADALTPMGVRPFAPLDDRKITYGVTRADNRLANLLLLALGVGVAGGAYALGLELVGG